MYTYSINTCMTVYECTHTAYQVCRLNNSVNHRLWTSPRSMRVKRPSSLQGTQHHTRTVLGPLVSHRHHTDMYTGRRGSLTTSHTTHYRPRPTTTEWACMHCTVSPPDTTVTGPLTSEGRSGVVLHQLGRKVLLSTSGVQPRLLLLEVASMVCMSSPQREVVLLGRLIHHVPAYGATNCGRKL